MLDAFRRSVLPADLDELDSVELAQAEVGAWGMLRRERVTGNDVRYATTGLRDQRDSGGGGGTDAPL